MSKSKGDFLTVSLLEEKGYNPVVYRMFCLQSHYRKPLVFTYEALDNAALAYSKLVARIAALKETEGEEIEEEKLAQFRMKFLEAMNDDLNTSQGITVLYDMLKADGNNATKRAAAAMFDEVFSLGLLDAAKQMREEKSGAGLDGEMVEFIEKKIAERKAAKKEKDFARADAIREELAARGIAIKDTREGTVWEKM